MHRTLSYEMKRRQRCMLHNQTNEIIVLFVIVNDKIYRKYVDQTSCFSVLVQSLYPFFAIERSRFHTNTLEREDFNYTVSLLLSHAVSSPNVHFSSRAQPQKLNPRREEEEEKTKSYTKFEICLRAIFPTFIRASLSPFRPFFLCRVNFMEGVTCRLRVPGI